MIARVLLGLSTLLLPHAASGKPALTVSPSEGVFDAPFNVELKGIPANAEVVIRTLRASEDGTVWFTTGTFLADVTGTVTAAKMPSAEGSYTGVSPHGLLCSALPQGATGFPNYLQTLIKNPRLPRSFVPPIEPISIRLEAFIDGEIVASATAIRGHAVGVVEEEIATEDGLRGVYFAPEAGQIVREPILLLNGSGGGVRRYAAARLASHGHPTLALAIYNYADLPTTLMNYPIERIRDAAHWLAQRADAEKVAVMGVSRGSEAAAHAAINFPDAFSAVILSVPSHLQDAGALGPEAEPGDGAWSLGGESFPVTDLGFTMNDPRIAEEAREFPGYNASGMVLSLWGSEQLEEQYGTNFGAINVPVLVLAGAEDGIWPSWISAERIKQKMERAGKAGLVHVRTYPGSGHSMVSVGFGGPLSTSSYNPFLQGFMDFGGTPNGNCDAGFESSRATIEFLNRIDATRREQTE